MTIIYIAGKVSGERFDLCTMKFGGAQIQLQHKGYEVINPLAVVNDWHCPWSIAMRKCIKELMNADAVYALPDCHLSKGATTELYIAEQLGIKIYRSLNEIPKI